MKIECVQICVNYSDFLATTLVHNKYIFDKIVVVTSDKDKDTADVCEYFHIQCVKTNIFEKEFNKGKAINLGLSHLDRDGWVVHMDGDIVLPPRARYLFEIAKPREDTLYGINRVMCPSYEAWLEFVAKPVLSHGCDIYIHQNQFPMGTAIGKLTKHPNDPSDLGWIPLGFFQMWYEGGKEKRTYSESHKDFARSDMDFAYQWARDRRALIPEVIGIHLQTDDASKMGINWSGRATKRFGP
jgi:glycosyltransferase involved in cell wall biosynthesis